MGASIRLEWQVDQSGYSIERREAKEGLTLLTSTPAAEFVVPRGGKLETYVVEGLESRIFERLANTPKTAEGVLGFANEWGLTSPEYQRQEQELRLLFDQIEDLRRVLRALEWAKVTSNVSLLERCIPKDGVGPMNIRFGRMRRDPAPRVFVEPKSLWLFCCCEVMQIFAGAATVRNCLNCGGFFSTGIKKGTRSTRHYCSDRCRVAMHRKVKHA